MRTLAISGHPVPALGQGTWNIGDSKARRADEILALRRGIELGMTLIDTAEMYGNGRSESLLGEAIAGMRDRVYLVSKVLPSNASGTGTIRACEASLKRLRVETLDLYLLHWRGRYPVAETVGAFERLIEQGKIRAWGVSNFNVSLMQDLFHVPDGNRCATNQVLYNVGSRDIESDLLPWCAQRGMPVMAYTPLGGNSLVNDPTLARIGAAHGCSASAVALAWAIRSGHVIAIPESGSAAHVKENAVALSLTLTPQDLETLDAAHPPPRH
jgi:diketogulonate reductase-like aldo/keto reductase